MSGTLNNLCWLQISVSPETCASTPVLVHLLHFPIAPFEPVFDDVDEPTWAEANSLASLKREHWIASGHEGLQSL
jgi:hypothetical protein